MCSTARLWRRRERLRAIAWPYAVPGAVASGPATPSETLTSVPLATTASGRASSPHRPRKGQLQICFTRAGRSVHTPAPSRCAQLALPRSSLRKTAMTAALRAAMTARVTFALGVHACGSDRPAHRPLRLRHRRPGLARCPSGRLDGRRRGRAGSGETCGHPTGRRGQRAPVRGPRQHQGPRSTSREAGGAANCRRCRDNGAGPAGRRTG